MRSNRGTAGKENPTECSHSDRKIDAFGSDDHKLISTPLATVSSASNRKKINSTNELVYRRKKKDHLFF